MSKPGIVVASWAAVVLASSYGALAGAQAPPSQQSAIHGLSREAVEHIPGIDVLFARPDASAAPRIQPGSPFREGEVVARFQLEVSDVDVLRIARQAGAKEVVRKSPLGLFLVRGPKSEAATQSLVDGLWARTEVVTASANYTTARLTGTFEPNDPHAVSGAQWYLEQPSDVDLDFPEAWDDFTRGSEDRVVAVMDTGINTEHPEFVGRLWVNPGEILGTYGYDDDGNGYIDDIHGWDSTSDIGDPDISDNDGGPFGTGVGHGTWVSSVLMANTDNQHQVAGVDHYARLLTVRGLNQDQGVNCDHIMGALDYLVMSSEYYDVINMSWVDYVNHCYYEIKNGLDALQDAGALVIAGTENVGGADANRYWPGRHAHSICIGSTDDTDNQADFTAEGRPALDFMAPGVDIYTASFDDPNSPNAFHFGDGNSFATPMVTGIASLALAIKPSLTKNQLYNALKESAVDLGDPGPDDEYGWGRVNAYDALLAVARIFEDGFETGDLNEWNSSSP
jgi:subtilisin family serine protease